MTRAPRQLVAHAFRRTAVPLASYYAVTLGLPLANGAQSGVAFVKHAVVVLVVPPVVIALACVVHEMWYFAASAVQRRKNNTTMPPE
jgi:hypothetical protein